MTNNLSALKRQIEMLSMFYPDNKIKECKINDLADKYSVASVTINRDLQDLRSMGIPINSVYGRGIEITGEVDPKVVTELIIKYIAFYNTEIIINDSLYKAVNESNITHIYIFSTLNNAIENKNKVLMNYKLGNRLPQEILVLPCKIIKYEDEICLLGIYNKHVELFNFNRILSLKITDNIDNSNYDDKINKYFEDSIEKTSPLIKITLLIEENIRIGSFIKPIKISKESNKNIIKAEVSSKSLDELAIWVIKQFGKVTVLEPKEVRDRIIDLAQTSLMKHNEDEEYSKLMMKEEITMYSPSKSWEIDSTNDNEENKDTDKNKKEIISHDCLRMPISKYQPDFLDIEPLPSKRVELDLPIDTIFLFNKKKLTILQRIKKWIKRK